MNPTSEDTDETVIEYTVREKLTKEQIVDLLASLGSKTQGRTEELAERLLGVKGLKPRDALSKLSTDDLRIIVRRFSIPEAPKATGILGIASSVLGDDRSQLIKRIEDFAAKQRPPHPRTVPSRPTVDARAPPKKTSVEQAAAIEGKDAQAPATTPPALEQQPIRVSSPTVPPSSAGAPATLPAFQETRDFVGAYKFAYQWDSENLYEAELLGALRGRFGINNAIRQQGESGRVYDIVVRNAARIEVKLPKQKAELDRMVGQVRRYLSQHPGGVIVVIIGFMMKNQQEIHNSVSELESAGAVVFMK